MNNQFVSQPKLPDPIFHIETDKIKPNPFQPRREFDEEALHELANSIREFGILHPLVVTKHEVPTEFGTNVEYHLISGERRLKAARIVGLERVPAIVKAVPTDRERLELAIIENIQRENLNPIETARAYAKLQDQFGLTQREIAVRVGKSREVIANAIRLLNLPTQIQDAVSRGQINESQARLLLMISDMQEQQAVFADLVNNNLSVRELRSRIQVRKQKAPMPAEIVPQVDPETMHIEEQLREALGTKVKLQKEGDGGKLTINFYSQEELQALLERLIKAREEAARNESLPKLPEEQTEFTV
jgi:ParB family chromosome partitioning protein